MQLNTLKPASGARQGRKRVGRGIGSGKGKTCGRGHKGQKSRSGGRIRAGFEGGQQPLQMRLPKFGFNSAKQRVTAEVTLSELSRVESDEITLQALIDARVVRRNMKRARIVLSGEISRAVVVKEGIKVTKGARAAIEAAGGRVEEPAAAAKPKKAVKQVEEQAEPQAEKQAEAKAEVAEKEKEKEKEKAEEKAEEQPADDKDQA